MTTVDRHDFGEYDGGNELWEWHAIKEEEMRRLLSSAVKGAMACWPTSSGEGCRRRHC